MYEKIDAALAALQPAMVDTLAKWIRIPSEKLPPVADAPFGQPLREMLTVALQDAQSLGMRTHDFEGYIGEAEMGEGDETMGILAHLDIVPAGDGWQVDPFGALIEDGKMYGRGTSDDKGPAVAALYAMKAILDAGIPLNKKVRLILGCDEESGWDDIRHYKTQRQMPDFGFSPDGMYPLINTEKGILQVALEGEMTPGGSLTVYQATAGQRPNVIPGEATAEIAAQDFAALQAKLAATGLDVSAEPLGEGRAKLISLGTAGHAAFPEGGKNAAVQLLLALKALGAGGAIARLGEGVGMDASGAGLGVAGRDDVSGALTMNLGILRIEDGRLTAMLDIRHPVLMGAEAITKMIDLKLTGTGVHARIEHAKAPLHVPADHPLVSALLDVYREETGDAAGPIAIGGGTYSRSMENCVAFGASFPGTPDLAHQAGENIPLSELFLNARIFAHAIARLAGA
ncbi:MAG: Sapep family Mn(2+)-dependent dipeptidase [Oscillospiraceae bacterium]|jgi:succinyl-diaminopimelate desuccinylase|nr:Sapep family Mn(2+)-dependent dipeptidase [Oscillospiraceae bacterium]